jgi:magnesium-transporting ATPase (P-type)
MCEIPSNVILAVRIRRALRRVLDRQQRPDPARARRRPRLGPPCAFVRRAQRSGQADDRLGHRLAHEANRKVGLCGQAPSDHPDFAAFLVHAGIDSISVNPDSFLAVKQAVAEAEHGANRLRRARSRPAWRILLDQLASLIVLLLLAAAAAALLFDRVVEAIAIGAAVLVNTVIGFFMELRATRAMEALARMGKTTTRVRRGGRETELPADALVPGDIVLLEAGDVVTADLRLLEANRLQCDEAALTGESVPVDKRSGTLDEEEPPLAERENMAFKGTAVTTGSGVGIVVATGMNTELGHISSLVEEARQSATPLEQRLDRLGRRLIWLTLVIAAVTAAAGLVAGKDLAVMLETAIALAIAAVPEGLPVVATLALAHGMRKMARRNAVVKRLSAVETLGTASLIFTDKTGTLTENHMTLARLGLADDTLRSSRMTVARASCATTTTASGRTRSPVCAPRWRSWSCATTRISPTTAPSATRPRWHFWRPRPLPASSAPHCSSASRKCARSASTPISR